MSDVSTIVSGGIQNDFDFDQRDFLACSKDENIGLGKRLDFLTLLSCQQRLVFAEVLQFYVLIISN